MGLEDGTEDLASTGIRSPDCPARSESLYRLSYPGRQDYKKLHFLSMKSCIVGCDLRGKFTNRRTHDWNTWPQITILATHFNERYGCKFYYCVIVPLPVPVAAQSKA